MQTSLKTAILVKSPCFKEETTDKEIVYLAQRD